MPDTADAFLHLVEAGWDAEATRRPHGQRTTVVVHVDVDTPMGALHGGPLLSEADRHYLSCDATCEVWFERDGRPIGAGRSTRTVNRRLRRALTAVAPPISVIIRLVGASKKSDNAAGVLRDYGHRLLDLSRGLRSVLRALTLDGNGSAVEFVFVLLLSCVGFFALSWPYHLGTWLAVQSGADNAAELPTGRRRRAHRRPRDPAGLSRVGGALR